MLYICKNSLVTILVFNLLRKSSIYSLNLNTYLLITILISLNETISSQMLFTTNAVSSALIMFFYISSQIESFTASIYVREVKMSVLTEYSLLSSLTVNAVNVSITFKIFIINSLKSVSLFFCLLFDILMHRNVLTFLVKTLIFKWLILLTEILTWKKSFNALWLKLTAVNFNNELSVISFSDNVTTKWELVSLNLWVCMLDFRNCFSEVAAVSVLCNYSIDFCSERMFSIYL